MGAIRTKTKLTRQERAEDALWLLENGETPWHVASALGIGLAYLRELLDGIGVYRADVMYALRQDEADKRAKHDKRCTS